MVDEGWLVAQLASEGVAPDRLEAARQGVASAGGDLAGRLWESGAVDEGALLRAISIAHRTSYVTIDKLARARIEREVLARVPAELAAAHHLLPLGFDAASRTLSIVAADPSGDAVEVARRASMAAQVRAYVALPQAVDAAIRRFYHDDLAAFEPLERRRTGASGPLPAQSHAHSTIVGVPRPQATPNTSTTPGPATPSGGVPAPRPGPPRGGPPTERGVGAPRRSSPSAPIPIVAGADDEFARTEPTRRGPTPPDPRAEGDTARLPTAELRLRSGEGHGVPMEAFLETLKVLVSVSEMGPVSWRQGHAAEVGRQALRLARRIGLPQREQAELSMAAYLHDVGKPDDPHLTLLGLSMVPDQRALAERVVTTPLRLFEAARLPEAVLATLGALYERVDGQGLPKRRRGREVPLGARILALVDAYVDLTMNPFGAAGGNVADRSAAMATLTRHKDTLFDGHLVEIFRQLVSGEDLRQRLLGDRPRVLLADADPESTSMLELKLVADGYEVRLARSAQEAIKAMGQWGPDLVVSEVTLDGGGGFALIEEAHRHKRTADVPFMFLSERAAAADLERGFALGAADYLTKPVPLDALVVKVRRLVIERMRTRDDGDSSPGRRVAGSLAEMAVPDVIEVLSKGKKSGSLRLTGQALRGDVWLDSGKIVHAAVPPDLAGQEALLKLLRLTEGEFAFVAGAAAPTRSIDASTEWLLLEAMRRMDEGIA